MFDLDSLVTAIARAMPLTAAQDELLRRLGAASCALFWGASEADWCLPIAEVVPWAEPLPEGARSLQEHRQRVREHLSLGFVGAALHAAHMDGREAVLRGLPLCEEEPEYGPALGDAEWSTLPAVPGLNGRSGALEALRLCWKAGPRVDQAAPELAAMVSKIAVTQAAARHLVPEAFPAEPARLVAIARPAAATAEEQLLAEDLSDERIANRYQVLKADGRKAPMVRLMEELQALGDKRNRRTIERLIERQAASKESPAFPWPGKGLARR